LSPPKEKRSYGASKVFACQILLKPCNNGGPQEREIIENRIRRKANTNRLLRKQGKKKM